MKKRMKDLGPNTGRIRDWMEGQSWYWFSINLSFNVFPWHWEREWTTYKWGLNVKFGPFGILILWN
jgi:hypothetical protein